MMMDDKSISLVELLSLGVYLGSIVYLIGLIVFVVLIYNKKTYKSIVLIIVKLLLSIILSVFIWRFWPLEIDIMQGVIFLPSIFAEIISISFLYFLYKKQDK